MSKTTINFSAAVNLYQARMGPNSNTKTPETHSLNAQTSSNGFKEEMLQHGKHAHDPTILRPVAVRVLSLRSSVIHGFCDRALTLPSCPVFMWACGFKCAARSSCFIRLHPFMLCLVLCFTQLLILIGCVLSCCHFLCEHVAYEFSH